jgi:hypothetical protein
MAEGDVPCRTQHDRGNPRRGASAIGAVLAIIAHMFMGCAAGVAASSPLHSYPFGARGNTGILHPVVIIEKDNRQTLPEYAKSNDVNPSEINKKFSPTGLFSCEGKWATAQLTGANNVVTTASHVFYTRQCKRYKFVKHCFFRPLNSARRYRVDLSSLLYGCNPDSRDNDWAVAKLVGRVENASFYNIPSPNIVIPEGQKVTQISYLHKNFKRKGKYPPTVQDCAIRMEKRSWYLHDCDSGSGSSGSAQLIENTIIGINTAESATERDGSTFSNTHWNLAIPLRGEFLNSIRKLLEN